MCWKFSSSVWLEIGSNDSSRLSTKLPLVQMVVHRRSVASSFIRPSHSRYSIGSPPHEIDGQDVLLGEWDLRERLV